MRLFLCTLVPLLALSYGQSAWAADLGDSSPIKAGMTGGEAALPVRSPVSAESYLAHLPPGERKAVLQGEQLVLDGRNLPISHLLVPTASTAGIADYIRERNPSLLVGSIFLLRTGEASVPSLTDLVNGIVDIESLSGVTYFSHSRNKVTILLDDVKRVEKAGSMTRLTPIRFDAPPRTAFLYFSAKDSNFGLSWFSLTMQSAGDLLSITIRNESPLDVTLFRAFGPGGFELRFFLIPVSQGFIVNGLCLGDPAPGASLFVDLFSAVDKRLRAVQGWLISRMSARTAEAP